MKLIADSGATKTDWVLIEDSGLARSFQTAGLNPYYTDSKGIEQVLQKELLPFVNAEWIRELVFYGAGCSSFEKAMVVEDALELFFREAEITVHTDLLGSARALFGDSCGIACILGTGSNSGYYDGKQIAHRIPSLGYFFGDEGSAAHLGKTFLKMYLMGKVPDEVRELFGQQHALTRDSVLDAVYRQPYPNRYLASFSSFLAEHNGHQYIRKMVTECFREFFVLFILDYPEHRDHEAGFTGAVAFHFEEILRELSLEMGVRMGKVLKSPVNGMAMYHGAQKFPF
ncbi:MAG: ATPase [Bacteroidales bacterium]|nr:ATPase [Bacteroidales bacterium]